MNLSRSEILFRGDRSNIISGVFSQADFPYVFHRYNMFSVMLML